MNVHLVSTAYEYECERYSEPDDEGGQPSRGDFVNVTKRVSGS